MRKMILAAALILTAQGAWAGLLTGQGATVLDQSNAQRATFSTNEKIGFMQIVNNGAASPNRIFFQFSVVAPNGNTVFRHVGNSVGGTVGNSASQVAGLAVSGFAQGPGLYTLKALATLDGVTLEQTQTFTISSPNLLLIYPPNGSQNLTDNPLTFQWYSSGAATYRVTVGDSPSLYNALFVQSSVSGSNSLTYPQNPSDPRERLSSGQTYWWKVEGLDLNGNIVATSQMPFSFSVSNTALTRDMAVTALDIAGPMDGSGSIPFSIVVKNQGNTTESNTPLRVTLGGLTAPNTPISVPQMSPGEALTFNVSAPIPTDMNEGLAIACLTIFDDTVSNNCKTVSVTRPAAISTGTFAQDCGSVGGEQIWQAIRQVLQDQGINLDDYAFTGMDGSLTCAELSALLDQLRQGQAQASLTGPPPAGNYFTAPTPGAPIDAIKPDKGPSAPEGLQNGERDEEPVKDDEILKAIGQALRELGIDLDGYKFAGMEGTLTRAELADLADQLRHGRAHAILSGPLPAGKAFASTAPAPVKEQTSDAKATPPSGLESSEEQPQTVVREKTWSGVALPLAKNTAAVLIKTEGVWKRLWAKLSDEPVPLIDFSAHSVIAVMAGNEDVANRIEIDNMQSLSSKLTVRYRLVSYVKPFAAPAAPAAASGSKPAPYLLIAIPRTSLKVSFEKIQEGSDGKK